MQKSLKKRDSEREKKKEEKNKSKRMKPKQGCTRTATTGCTYTVFQEWNPAS